MDSKTIILKTYENLTEANFDKHMLEENGIACFLSDYNVVQLYPMFSSPFGGIKLHILEENEEKALQLLDQIHEKDA